MKTKPSLSNTILKSMTFVTVLSIALSGGLWLYTQYADLRSDSARIREGLLASHRALIKNEVAKAIDYLHYRRAQAELHLRDTIEDRVYEAHAIAQNLYEQNKDTRPAADIQEMIKDALRPIRFNQGRGYYFVVNLEGVNELFADHPEMEGRDMLPVRGGRGEYVVRDLIALVRSQGEGFYKYHWTKPNQAGDQWPKIAFVKLFEPYHWFIGTGEYLDDVETDVQNEVIERIEKIRFRGDGYIFAGTYDGFTLSGPGKGRNMRHVTDVNGLKIVEELIRLAKSGGGYLEYVMPKLEDKRPVPKLSYVTGVNEWRWYVGAGLYIDDIEKAVTAKMAEFQRQVRITLAQIVGVLLALVLVALIAARRTAQKTKANYDLFASFFTQAGVESATLDPEGMDFVEFENLAHSANRMIGARLKAETALRESEARFRALTENTTDVTVIVDRAGVYQYASPSVKAFGWAPEEIEGRHYLDWVHPEDLAQVKEAIARAVQHPGETLKVEELRVRRQDGTWVPLEGVFTCLYDLP
ncbi:MAG: cache domain-containing protein, partial [Thermodesulfobacteriota bacterium]